MGDHIAEDACQWVITLQGMPANLVSAAGRVLTNIVINMMSQIVTGKNAFTRDGLGKQ